MKSFNLLIVVNSLANSNQPRFYCDGLRISKSKYDFLTDTATRQDTFSTRINGFVARHFKTIYY